MNMEQKFNPKTKQLDNKGGEADIVNKVETSNTNRLQSPITKETRKYPTDDEILDQIIEVIKGRLSLPVGSTWDSYSQVKGDKNFLRSKAITKRFTTFKDAVNLALKRAEEKNIKLYYRKKE